MCMEIIDITTHLRNEDILKFLCSVQERELGLRRKEKNKDENLESKHQTKGQLHHVIEFRFKSSFVFVFFFLTCKKKDLKAHTWAFDLMVFQ